MNRTNNPRDELRLFREKTAAQRARLDEMRKQKAENRQRSMTLPPQVQLTQDRMRGCERFLAQSTSYTRDREIEGAREWSKNRNFTERDPYRNFRSNKIRREESRMTPNRGRAFTSPNAHYRQHDHRGPRNRTMDHSRVFYSVSTPSPSKRRKRWTPPSAKRARNNEVETLRAVNAEFEIALKQMTDQFKQAIDRIGHATERINKVQSSSSNRLNFIA